jgi:hypothetical protein
MRAIWHSFWVFPFLIFIVFGRSLSYDFVYDDHARILLNPGVQNLPSIKDAFTNPDLQSNLTDLNTHTYRPLQVLDFALDYSLWKKNPRYYRLVNLFTHAACTIMVTLFASLVLGLSAPAAYFAGLLFAVHPAQIESVVWISERSNLMSLFFMLSAAFFWLRFRRGPRSKSSYLFSMILFLLALFYRETAVCFPFICFFIDSENFSKKWRAYIPLAFVLAIFLIMRTMFLGHIKQTAWWGGTFLSNLATAAAVFPMYLQTIFFPYPLTINYAPSAASSFLEGRVFIGLMALISLVALVIVLWRKNKSISLSLAGILVFWLPTSNIVPLTHLFNERWLYPIMVFVAFIKAELMQWARVRLRRLLIDSMAVVLITILSILSIHHLPVWRSDLALWGHAVKINPDWWFNWVGLGMAQKDYALTTTRRADMELAASSIFKSLQLNPTKSYAPTLWFDLAEINLYLGAKEQAENCAHEALALDPNLSGTWRELKEKF